MRALLLMLPFLSFGQAPAPHSAAKLPVGVARCHVYAVNTDGAKPLMAAFQAGTLTMEELKKKAADLQKRLPDFDAKIAEEETTTRHFEIEPGLTVTLSVMFTDESMPIGTRPGESVWLGIVASDGPVANALTATGASLAEANFSPSSYKLLVKTKRVIGKALWTIGGECQFAGDQDFLDRHKVPATR